MTAPRIISAYEAEGLLRHGTDVELAAAAPDLAASVVALHDRAEKAEANYRWMVERAADQRLDGYRELGAKCAALEAERDQLRAALREYVEEDDVAEGGEWEVENAHWLRIKRRAMTLLGMEGGHRD